MRRAALVLAALLAGCGPRGPVDRPRDGDEPVERVVMEPIVLEAKKVGDSFEVEAYDAALLFDEAYALYQKGAYEQARDAYERILAQFPGTVLAPPATFNLALCHERLGDLDAAAELYDSVVEEHPASAAALDAMFRRGYCLEELGRHDAAVDQYGEVLALPDVPGEDVLEAMSRIGHIHLADGELEQAEDTLTAAVQYYVKQSQVERFENAYYAGQAQYDLAELWRLRFEQVGFSTDEAAIRGELDVKLGHMVEASDAYVQTIKIGNYYWAVAAGYQVGQLLRTLYDDMMAAPLPPELDTQELVETYYEYLEDYIRPLLSRAVSVWEKTLLMAERVGIECKWVEMTEDKLSETRGMLAEGLVEEGAEQEGAGGGQAPAGEEGVQDGGQTDAEQDG
jgi:tetratricopeptide (TPR) repeat protein